MRWKTRLAAYIRPLRYDGWMDDWLDELMPPRPLWAKARKRRKVETHELGDGFLAEIEWGEARDGSSGYWVTILERAGESYGDATDTLQYWQGHNSNNLY